MGITSFMFGRRNQRKMEIVRLEQEIFKQRGILATEKKESAKRIKINIKLHKELDQYDSYVKKLNEEVISLRTNKET
jgi:hypothetical protein